jgi:hypothetical protein
MKFKFNAEKITTKNQNDLLDDLSQMYYYYKNSFLNPLLEEYYLLQDENERLEFLKLHENYIDIELFNSIVSNENKFKNLQNEKEEAITNIGISFSIVKKVFIDEEHELDSKEIIETSKNILKTHKYYSYLLKDK